MAGHPETAENAGDYDQIRLTMFGLPLRMRLFSGFLRSAWTHWETNLRPRLSDASQVVPVNLNLGYFNEKFSNQFQEFFSYYIIGMIFAFFTRKKPQKFHQIVPSWDSNPSLDVSPIILKKIKS